MAVSNDSTPGTSPNGIIQDCEMSFNLEYDTVMAAICVTLGLFGLVYTFVGYRCFKAIMFLSGLIFGGTVVFVLCQEESILQHTLSFSAIVGISAGISVLCGFITMLVRYVGLFLQGFFLGLLVAVGAIIALQKFYNPTTPWIPVGILFGTGIIFAILTLKWQKHFIVVSTSVMGAALICTCVEYFMEHLLLFRYIWKSFMAVKTIEVCWFSWVILGIWPTLALLGSVIQWKFTGKGYDHTDVIIWQGQRKRVRTHLVRQRQRNRSPTDTLTSVASEQPRPNSARTAHSRSHERNPQPQLSRNQSHASQRSSRSATRVAEAADPGNFDTLPPSYDDCVRRGVGKPVSEQDQSRIIRTKHGSFLAPAGRNPNRETQENPVRDQILQNAETGIGYSESNDPGSASGTRRNNSGSRERNTRRGLTNTPRSSGARRGRGRAHRQSPSRARNNSQRGSSRSARASPASHSRSRRGNGSLRGSSRGRNSNAGSIDDRQSLLSSEATPNSSTSAQSRRPPANEAMVAHARRVQVAQERWG